MNASPQAYDALRGMAATASRESPRVGKLVRIETGKHRGKVGRVFWHGEDHFSQAGRYDANMFSATMRVVDGRYGYRIGVEPDDNSSRFFCKADYAMVCIED